MDAERTRPLMTRIPPEMVPRIDAARGEVKRERWVRERLDEALTALGFPPDVAPVKPGGAMADAVIFDEARGTR